MAHPVVLCTDFGPASAYVGQMKLVISRACPGAPIIDLAHDLPAQDLVAAALVLQTSTRVLPPNCVLCAVIDPTVGSGRRILAGRTRLGFTAIMPDNGLLSVVGAFTQLHQATPSSLWRQPVSPVFHGRDIFAPLAAHLAGGGALEELGPAVDPTTVHALPTPLRAAHIRDARVIYTDPFGNLVTNLHRDDLPPNLTGIIIAGKNVNRVEHYAEAPPGSLLFLVGSHDHLEVAVRQGSAARALDASVGTPLTLVRSTPPPASQSR